MINSKKTKMDFSWHCETLRRFVDSSTADARNIDTNTSHVALKYLPVNLARFLHQTP